VTIDQREITKIKKDPSDLAEIEKKLLQNLEEIHKQFKNRLIFEIFEEKE
jgi:biotin-(acetyl-CoA carboxylase) ligase